jgi:hypothetical protein
VSVYVSNKAITDGPHLNRRHIDGPLLTWAGSLHWLTWKQRISLRLGLKSIDEIACEQWPKLAAIRASLISGDTSK